MKKEQVVERWIEGRIGRSDRNAFSTDGKSLFSYNLEIGITQVDGMKTVFDYTKTGRFISQTTSKHVAAAKSKADFVRQPPERAS